MRFLGWRVRLQAYLTDWQGAEFRYGKHDCALFAAGAVQAMTGRDLARGLRGYRTEAGGVRKVRKAGYRDHVDVFGQNLPAAERLRVGDVAVVESDGGLALGVVQGRGVFVMRPDQGLTMVPLSYAVRGFAV